jgi:DNA primase
MTDRADDLVAVLENLGVEIHSSHGDEIQGRCPLHSRYKGRESTRFSWYMNVDTGLHHCFTCGAKGSLSWLISELVADPMDLWRVQSHIIRNGLRRLTAEEAEYNPGPVVDWIRYAQFDRLPDMIVEARMFDAEVAHRYGIRWDRENRASIAPIVSPLGELWGWQAKKTGWVNNVPEGVHKGLTLFGIERAFGHTAVLVESPLDVPRFHTVYMGMDFNCVASFGANVSLRQAALLSKFDNVIIALDNDRAGHAETDRLRTKELIHPRNSVKYWVYRTSHKDIGELPDDEILDGLTRASTVHRPWIRSSVQGKTV